MIRQITLIRFKSDTVEADIREMNSGFLQLRNVVPGIKRFEFGPDLELEDATLDYALVIDFDSVNDWKSYRAHPDHVAFAKKCSPLIEQVERVQYRID